MHWNFCLGERAVAVGIQKIVIACLHVPGDDTAKIGDMPFVASALECVALQAYFMRLCKIFVLLSLLHGRPQFEKIAEPLKARDSRLTLPCCVAARAGCLTYLL